MANKNPNFISIGTLKLPAGKETTIGIIYNILEYLSFYSLFNLHESNIFRSLTKEYDNDLSFQISFQRLIMHAEVNDDLVYLVRKYKKKSKLIITPLVYACQYGNKKAVEAIINTYTKNGKKLKRLLNQEGNNAFGVPMTPLQAAVWYSHPSIVKYLLHKGADVSVTDKKGRNILHIIVRFNSSKKLVKIVEILLSNMSYCDINRKATFDGQTPYDYAFKFNKSEVKDEIIELISKHGGLSWGEIGV